MSFAGYFLSVLFCPLSMLISDSRFDLVWFRLSCDHGWIRSGSVNVRKQQQQQQQQQKADIQPWRRELIREIKARLNEKEVELKHKPLTGWMDFDSAILEFLITGGHPL